MLDRERHIELEDMNLQIRAMSDEQIDKELSDYLENGNEKMILLLKEVIRRQSNSIKEQNRRILQLEEQALKKSGKKTGRKKKIYYYDGEELTDKKIVELIDGGIFESPHALGRFVNARKNVIYNRYKKAKELKTIERNISANKDS